MESVQVRKILPSGRIPQVCLPALRSPASWLHLHQVTFSFGRGQTLPVLHFLDQVPVKLLIMSLLHGQIASLSPLRFDTNVPRILHPWGEKPNLAAWTAENRIQQEALAPEQ